MGSAILRTPSAVLALAVGLALFASCTSAAPEPGRTPSPEAFLTPRNINELFEEMARQAPGFGGFARIGDSVEVFLKDPSPERQATAEAVVTALFEARGTADGLEIDFVPVQYDFLELTDWYDSVRIVLTTPGVTFTELDERENRIKVGVESSEARDLVEEELAALDVPREAVIIELTEPVTAD